MKREDKSTLISALQSSLKEANGVFVVENHGLTVQEMEGLRNELRPLVSVFKVVKNRLMKLALKDSNFEAVSDMMKRPPPLQWQPMVMLFQKYWSNLPKHIQT